MKKYSDTSLISVVIPNFNGDGVIEDCLRFLYSQKGVSLEIIVVDDISTDHSFDYVLKEKESGRVNKLIRNSVKRGFSGSCFAGGEVATGEFIVFLNSDAFIKKESFLRNALSIFFKETSLGVLGFKQKNSDGTIQFVGSNPDYFLSLDFRDINPSTSLQRKEFLEESFMVGGACFMLKMSVYKKVGGIDPDYFLYVEEIDLMWRVRIAGYSIKTAINLDLEHLGGGSTKNGYDHTTNAKKIFFRERNTLVTMCKNYDFFPGVFIVLFYLFLKIGEGIFIFILGRENIARAYFNAIKYLFTNIVLISKKRRLVRKLRKISSLKIIRKGFLKPRIFDIEYVIKRGLPRFD